jgi:hypothetical protein
MSATARPGTLYSWIALGTDLSGDSMDVRKGWPCAAPARHEVAPAARQSAIGHLDVYTTARSTVLLHLRTDSCVSTIIETPLCNPAMTLFRCCSGRHTYGSSPEAPGGGGTHSASPWHGRYVRGLVVVNCDAARLALVFQRLAKESLGRIHIPPATEMRRYRMAALVHRAVQVHPLAV